MCIQERPEEKVIDHQVETLGHLQYKNQEPTAITQDQRGKVPLEKRTDLFVCIRRRVNVKKTEISTVGIRLGVCSLRKERTMRLETISKDFGGFWNYLGDSNSILASWTLFFVRGSIACNETVHVHVLWPVCTHTIPFRMLVCP